MNCYQKLIFLCVLCIYAQATCIGQCIDGDCLNGFGKRWFKKRDTVLYVGQFKNKYPDGDGTATYRNGKRYEGQWFHGMWHGNGKLILSDGQVIAGIWENSRLKHATELIASPVENVLLASESNSSAIDPIHTPIKENSRPFEEPRYSTNIPVEPIRHNPITDSNADAEKNASNWNVVSKVPEIWALAVGVAEYENPNIQTLKYPDNDAFKMFAFWMSQQGGSLDDDHARVIVDDAATKKMVLNDMNALFSKAGIDDMAIFFFSGHGLAGAFLTHDYDGAELQLRHREINAVMSKCIARHKLIIADACFAGSYIASKGVPIKPEAGTMSDRFYSEIQKSETGTAYFLSCSPDEESLEVNTFHDSVFTHFVLKGLKGAANTNGDKIITLQELYNYVKANVTVYAKSLGKQQTPILKGNYDPNMPVSVLK